jgi:hypothetical protein
MFRKRDPQFDMFETNGLLTPAKAKRLRRSWADTFRNKALPLIDEEKFAPMYCLDNGRPNVPVEVVLGVHILKEMFNLTDDEALEQLEFNLLWHHALRLSPEDTHLCQKTLHNFRFRLMKHEGGRLAFQDITDRIIKALGIKPGRQRLDSTHILSNIAILTRLGLFCETIRMFLRALHWEHSNLFDEVPAGLRLRYLKEDDADTGYSDARSREGRRRLSVCARDLYRLVDSFRGSAASDLYEYSLLQRLLDEQCETVEEEERLKEDEDDVDEGGVPVVLKPAKAVSGDSLQTPHDEDVTYSGHKGKGYEVQVAETCHEENEVEIITHVEVTPSSGSDANATIPVIEALAEREIQPEELVADTTYGSVENALDTEELGTELVSPIGGKKPQKQAVEEVDSPPLTSVDFEIDAGYAKPSVCPAGQKSIAEYSEDDANIISITFDDNICDACPLFSRCPVKIYGGHPGATMKVDLAKRNLGKRRRAEESGEFALRYSIRAGIEATNSELKRGHGLDRLRVRGSPRVALAVYLKALACNIKRMVCTLTAQIPQSEVELGREMKISRFFNRIITHIVKFYGHQLRLSNIPSIKATTALSRKL